jgi:hypothetical protein
MLNLIVMWVFYEWHIYDLARSMNHGLWYVGKMYGDYCDGILISRPIP